jgi:hypothetical protein
MLKTTERTQILKMVEAGQINSADAIKLLTALQSAPPARLLDADKRWLHVQVSDLDSKQSRVQVNLPLSWVDVGLRIGRNFAPELDNVDWNQIFQTASGNQSVRLLEVEDYEDNQRVEIVVE